MINLPISPELWGKRIDQALVTLLPGHSRGELQRWIESGSVLVDEKCCDDRSLRLGARHLLLSVLPPPPVRSDWMPYEGSLELIYEDHDLLVINKPVGLVVHPGTATPLDTLAGRLLYHFPELSQLPRVGIIHRLDKDTTGLLVVARTLPAYHSLGAQLKARTICREYVALVWGMPPDEGTIQLSIQRHPTKRTQMAATTQGGRSAKTDYRVLERFRAHSYLRLRLESGRTHQIRVHCHAIGYPIVGDPTYTLPRFRRALSNSPDRQLLHARLLALLHPGSGEQMEWSVPLPEDMTQLLVRLREELG